MAADLWKAMWLLPVKQFCDAQACDFDLIIL